MLQVHKSYSLPLLVVFGKVVTVVCTDFSEIGKETRFPCGTTRPFYFVGILLRDLGSLHLLTQGFPFLKKKGG